MVALTVYLAAAAVLLTVMYLKFIFRRRRPDEPPIPKGHWLWGNGEEFSKHAVKFLHKTQKQLGDIFTIRLFNQCLTMVNDPHLYEQFVKEKNFDFDTIQRQVNHNVFSFELVDARKMLKEAGKTVKGPHLATGMNKYSAHLNNSFREVVGEKKVPMVEGGEWYTDGLRNFNSQTLFSALFYTIFGKGNKNDVFEPSVIYKNFDQFHKYFNYLWLGLPINMFPKAGKALSVLCQQPDSKAFLARDDLSDYIRFSTNFMLQNGQTEQDIIGHNLVYLHVNYNTFRMAFWCLYHLLEKREALEALREEVAELVAEKKNDMGDDETEVTIDLEELDSLKILDSITKETLRMNSGVFMVRAVTEDTWFQMNNGKSYKIRKGDKVAMYPPAIHKDAEIYENPDEFKYDRFVDATFYKNGQVLKNPIMSFGSICPGKKYALTQAKWFLLSLVHSFDMELLEGESTKPDVNYHGHEILPPTNEVQIRYRSRKNCDLIFVN